MSTPFATFSTLQRWILLLPLLMTFALLAATLNRQGEPLRTEAAPLGILSYEFSWTGDRAGDILGSWDADTTRHQLYLDFPFLVVYPVLLSLVCAMLAARRVCRLSDAGIFLSWWVLAAAPLDAIENLALLRMVNHGPHGALAGLAGVSATLKFALLLTALTWILIQGVALLLKPPRSA